MNNCSVFCRSLQNQANLIIFRLMMASADFKDVSPGGMFIMTQQFSPSSPYSTEYLCVRSEKEREKLTVAAMRVRDIDRGELSPTVFQTKDEAPDAYNVRYDDFCLRIDQQGTIVNLYKIGPDELNDWMHTWEYDGEHSFSIDGADITFIPFDMLREAHLNRGWADEMRRFATNIRQEREKTNQRLIG